MTDLGKQPELTFLYTLTRADQSEVTKGLMLQTPGRVFALVAMPTLVICILALPGLPLHRWFFLSENSWLYFLVVEFFAIGIYYAILKLIMSRVWSRMIQRRGTADIKTIITDEGITQAWGSETLSAPWSKITRVRETRNTLYIYAGARLFQAIPMHALNSAETRSKLKNLLKQHTGHV